MDDNQPNISYGEFPSDVTFNVRTTRPMREAMKDVAKARGISVSDVVRMALMQYMEVAFPEFWDNYRRHATRMAQDRSGENANE